MKAKQEDLLARMDHQTKYLLSHINQSTQNLPETEKIHPGMMQSVEEHQDTPTADTAVMPVGEPRKRHRVQKLATERRQKQKEATQGYCRSQRRVTVADRRPSAM
jgi:hypothetical protein